MGGSIISTCSYSTDCTGITAPRDYHSKDLVATAIFNFKSDIEVPDHSLVNRATQPRNISVIEEESRSKSSSDNKSLSFGKSKESEKTPPRQLPIVSES